MMCSGCWWYGASLSVYALSDCVPRELLVPGGRVPAAWSQRYDLQSSRYFIQSPLTYIHHLVPHVWQRYSVVVFFVLVLNDRLDCLLNTFHRVLEKSLRSPRIWMFHTMHDKAWQKCVVKRFFSGLNLTLYFSFWGFAPRPPHTGLCPWSPLEDFRPPDPLTFVLESCNFRSLKCPWILSYEPWLKQSRWHSKQTRTFRDVWSW